MPHLSSGIADYPRLRLDFKDNYLAVLREIVSAHYETSRMDVFSAPSASADGAAAAAAGGPQLLHSFDIRSEFRIRGLCIVKEGFVMTSSLDHAQLWNVESGECTRQIDHRSGVVERLGTVFRSVVVYAYLSVASSADESTF